jgi:twitching motility protein PilI
MQQPEQINNLPGKDWLAPSIALTRFNPGQQLRRLLVRAEPMLHQRYGYVINTLRFLTPMDQASEIVSMVEIFPLPNTAPCLLGLINLRGNIVPVVDIMTLLYPGADAIANRRLLIIGKGEAMLGIMVDGFPRPITLPSPLPNIPPLPHSLEDFVAAAYPVESDIWLELKHDEFFTWLKDQIAS